MERIFF